MINISELEKRWFKYKLKSYAPYIIIITTLTIILILLLIFISKTPIKNKMDIEHKTVKKVKKVKIVKEDINITNTKKINSKKNILLPSLAFLENITIENKKEIPIIVQNKHTKKEIPTVKIEAVEKIDIQIKKQNISSDINGVIKRFKKNNNPALSLFIAKKYYEIANYDEAYNYSLITNQLNDSIEDSWIIFAKSLVKLKQKDKAVKVLNRYFKYSNSNKAKILLDNILSGKFQ